MFAYSLYEKTGLITYSEMKNLTRKGKGVEWAAYWMYMDDGKHYNGYFANGNKQGNLNYTPKAGDLILYTNGAQYDAGHVAVVYEVGNGYIKTLEGNLKYGHTTGGIRDVTHNHYKIGVTCKDIIKGDTTKVLGYFSLESFLNSK